MPTLPNFPTRTIRSTAPAGGGVTPGYGMTAPTYGTSAIQPARVQLTPEETTIIMEAERQRLVSKGSPNAMIIPPTALTPQTAPQNAAPGGAPNINPMPR